jgi:hypothetical protein
MELRAKTLGRLGLTALFTAVLVQPRGARAEVDRFGVGDGHRGPKTVVGDETINAYGAITADVAAGASQITISTVIGNPAGFAANDLVLVWRATGVAPSEAPSGNQTKRLDLATSLATTSAASEPGLVGTYEFARIATRNGSTISLTKPLTRGFTKLVSQVVTIPEYTTVTVPVGTSLRAAAWQEIGGTPANPDPTKPWAGGILAFMATGTITNNGTIHANGRGFHGGVPEDRILQLGLACNSAPVDGDPKPDQSGFAPKGQGVVHSRYSSTVGGKGNISMAGGGANCVNAGGGGGANSGNGGSGGGTAAALGAGGLGGVGIDYNPVSRLTMGGGGGSGRHAINLLEADVSFGGFGGGVVYIRGGSMAGNGRLQANGANGEDSGIAGLPSGVASEGSGGGGAGGTIVVRLTGALDCDALGAPGGNGGNASVAGLPVFGGGGGGGGGRVLFQAASKTAKCDVLVPPGTPGNGGGGGTQPGGPGVTQPPPSGGFCFDPPPGSPDPCADPKPICDLNTGECKKCSGPFGGGSPQACKASVEPVCKTDGSCVPCTGDFNSGSPAACQLVGSPYCFTTGGPTVIGSCGKCTKNDDCTGAHAGPICNVVAGSCGTACTKDEDCKTTEWCAPRDASGGNVCTPKTPNSQPLPPYPPIDGECTEAKGKRTCLSAKCEPADDLCGLANGSPCAALGECRSEICFTDKLCGLPNGEPCTGNGQCRSDQCKDGVCVGCKEDKDCQLGQVCDAVTESCTPGCRPTATASTHGGCPAGEECVSPDGSPIGQCQPPIVAAPPIGNDGGVASNVDDTAGIVEGGGCACSSTLSSTASPFAILGALSGVLVILRRRLRTRLSDRG